MSYRRLLAMGWAGVLALLAASRSDAQPYLVKNINEPGDGPSAVPGTDKTGFFWFFNPTNVELVVKALDGTTVNGHLWIFFGALSDVEYTIAVTDTGTGLAESYHNPPGKICGGADTEAF